MGSQRSSSQRNSPRRSMSPLHTKEGGAKVRTRGAWAPNARHPNEIPPAGACHLCTPRKEERKSALVGHGLPTLVIPTKFPPQEHVTSAHQGRRSESPHSWGMGSQRSSSQRNSPRRSMSPLHTK